MARVKLCIKKLKFGYDSKWTYSRYEGNTGREYHGAGGIRNDHDGLVGDLF